jgi:hypothetical protein
MTERQVALKYISKALNYELFVCLRLRKDGFKFDGHSDSTSMPTGHALWLKTLSVRNIVIEMGHCLLLSSRRGPLSHLRL